VDSAPQAARSDPVQDRPRGAFPTFAAIRRRILSGLVFALPIAITLWVVYWLVGTLQVWVLDPVAALIRRLVGREHPEALPWWWTHYASPVIALPFVLIFLYVLGLIGRSRIHRGIDWLLLRVPVVTTIYKAVRNVFDSLEARQPGEDFKRVVLVPFPSRDVRSPGFVARSMRDRTTGRTILCVYIPYCPIPTTGLIVTVPEDDVTETDWDVNSLMQAIISFGLSTPRTIAFDQSAPVKVAGRPGADD
jgi:uncharacterized membrane protein